MLFQCLFFVWCKALWTASVFERCLYINKWIDLPCPIVYSPPHVVKSIASSPFFMITLVRNYITYAFDIIQRTKAIKKTNKSRTHFSTQGNVSLIHFLKTYCFLSCAKDLLFLFAMESKDVMSILFFFFYTRIVTEFKVLVLWQPYFSKCN